MRRSVDRYFLIAAARKQIARWSESNDFGVVYCDNPAIEHIVANLVENALRYTARYVEVGLPRDKSSFYIRVWNDAPAFPRATCPIPLTAVGRWKWPGARSAPTPTWGCS